MIHYFKADLYRIYQERKGLVSLAILLALSFFVAFLLKDNPSPDTTALLLQILAQFIPLFFIVPANIFFGEDFTNRTINNIVIKQQRRHLLFVYKLLASFFFNLAYVALSYFITGIFRLLLHGEVNFSLITASLLMQIPLLLCISLLCSLIFIVIHRVGQAYLCYILLAFFFDNICNLIFSNLLHMNISADYFLFASLQNGNDISMQTVALSLVGSLIYVILGYQIFQHKELK